MANWCVPVVKRYPGVLSQLAKAGYWNELPLWVLKSTTFLAGARDSWLGIGPDQSCKVTNYFSLWLYFPTGYLRQCIWPEWTPLCHQGQRSSLENIFRDFRRVPRLLSFSPAKCIICWNGLVMFTMWLLCKHWGHFPCDDTPLCKCTLVSVQPLGSP